MEQAKRRMDIIEHCDAVFVDEATMLHPLDGCVLEKAASLYIYGDNNQISAFDSSKQEGRRLTMNLMDVFREVQFNNTTRRFSQSYVERIRMLFPNMESSAAHETTCNFTHLVDDWVNELIDIIQKSQCSVVVTHY